MKLTRLLPLVVAWPLFQNNLDSTMLGTALPVMAQGLGVKVLHLNLAVTCYLLGLALCLPLSGWAADRWGPRRVFLFAVVLFSLAATLCGFAPNLSTLIGLRILQGVGGALMLPASRLLLLRNVTAGDMVEAMIWFTVPGSLARMMGPLVGGALVTWGDWSWVFLINLPIGVLGLLMLIRWLPADPPKVAGSSKEAEAASSAGGFDGRGFLMLAGALTALTTVLEVGAKGLMPVWGVALIGLLGLGLAWAYWRHAMRVPEPLIDLRVLRHRTFRIAIVGAVPLRISIGAVPFLLPLLMQTGFGLTPMASGLITVAGAIGSLGSRGLLLRLLRRVGFRKLLIGAAVGSALCCLAYALLRADTPVAAMFALILLGGVCNALAMVALNSLAYTDVSHAEASHASTTATMVQQLSIMFGVAVAAALLSLVSGFHADQGSELRVADFAWVFVAVGALVATTALSFRGLKDGDGHTMRPTSPAPKSGAD